MNGKMIDETIGIYMHIPFCIKKCPYCDFNSIVADHVPEEEYTEAVLRELSSRILEMPALSDRALETVYIGGGTPSLISAENIKRLVSGIRQVFSAPGQPEITIEVNPGTVTPAQLASLYDAGVNRMSIGVQSFRERELQSLGRAHSVQDSLRCYEYARKAGFRNIGMDLIFGIPGQSVTEWEADLEAAVSLRPEHISLYNLTIEQGTPFFRLKKEGELFLPPEEEQIRMYELGMDLLTSEGYHHYEISNFALDGFESRHNNRYWLALDYLGLGAGAHSYLSSPDWGVRWWNEKDPLRYVEQTKNAGHAAAGMERLTHEEAITEGIFLGLRRVKGIDLDWFAGRFQVSWTGSLRERIDVLKSHGLIREGDNALSLTRKGILVSNDVALALI